MHTTAQPAASVDRVFRAIAHSGRRHLLARLAADGGLSLGELCQGLSMSRQAVSQHLEILESAGLVVSRWHGREKLHYLNPTPLCEAHDAWLAPIITRSARALIALRAGLEGLDEAGSDASRATDRKAGGDR